MPSSAEFFSLSSTEASLNQRPNSILFPFLLLPLCGRWNISWINRVNRSGNETIEGTKVNQMTEKDEQGWSEPVEGEHQTG